MAILHRATLTPSKHELLQAWLPSQPWLLSTGPVEAESLAVLGAYRFDDPAGQVGVETFLVRATDRIVQVPLTYRSAPLEGMAEAGRFEHSVLGQRWVYPGWVDPVYAQTLSTTIRSGGQQAELLLHTDDSPVRREPDTFVQGSGHGAATAPDLVVSSMDDGPNVLIDYDGTRTLLLRVLSSEPAATPADRLAGRWPGQADPVVLAYFTS